MIKINLEKARKIANVARRAKRADDMKHHDIMATVPAKAKKAEAARQVIRDADAIVQKDIENASDDTSLKKVMVDAGLVDAGRKTALMTPA